MSDTEAAGRARTPWPLVAVGVVLVAALAFAGGRFTAFGTLADATDAGTGPNAADAGFARDMQVHHAQAVEMAMIEYRATSDEELRVLSYDIATAQSGQRGEMFGWLVGWGLPQSGDPLMSWMSGADHGHADDAATTEELEAAMGMATDEELARLQSLSGAEQDCLFVELMIRHHAGAIEMTEAVVELGSVERVIDTARQMGENQTAEIDAMQDVQERLGCSG
ncbi:DUF305 domain-containing protein [Microbacterium betulae]|uniref:DUF305 domain-containing protein n=1 Tax=Microbacterium betulae TaxID=2981139 RepID=A0AA97I7R1_9MICO|nr:DUF305 domain-containing protein [Microbacterium sp. AB]WOF23730.1 DUF305 domain-containing protein [Microbacterium sp. AB]